MIPPQKTHPPKSSLKKPALRDVSHRPLSPHLQIYRVQLTSLLSILHRATGLFLFAAAFGWCLYLLVWPSESVCCWMSNPIVCGGGILFLGGFVLSLFYHLLAGVRHLFWDWGWGFELRQVYWSGSVVLIGTVCLAGGTLWYLL